MKRILLTDKQVESLATTLTFMKAIVDESPSDSYVQIFARKITQARLDTLLEAVNKAEDVK